MERGPRIADTVHEPAESRTMPSCGAHIEVAAGVAVRAVWTVPERAHSAVILAHGAGNDMEHPLLREVHGRLAAHTIAAARFNFPYKEAGRRIPDPPRLLEQTWLTVIRELAAHIRPERLFLGGKSMGGRIASHLVASGARAAGLVFLGYPLHAANRPEQLRDEHLGRINCPMLFVQGTRDALCRLDLLQPVLDRLPQATLHLVPEGDHSLHLPKRAGRDEQEVYREVGEVVARWIARTGANP